jgi:hypothetical protein
LNFEQILSDERNTLHVTLIDAIRQLSQLTSSELLAWYDMMLPDLIHNRQRWYVWADEQKYQVENLFDE